jgi:hypothetical protein
MQLNDPVGDNVSSFDITNVSLTRIGNNLQFIMTLSSPPHPALGCYKLLIDADSNKSTGDIRGNLGVDYFRAPLKIHFFEVKIQFVEFCSINA